MKSTGIGADEAADTSVYASGLCHNTTIAGDRGISSTPRRGNMSREIVGILNEIVRNTGFSRV